MKESPHDRVDRVIQIGNSTHSQGGVASVIRQFAGWSDDRTEILAISSYDPKDGRIQAVRRLWSAARKVHALRHGTSDVAHVHVTQRGSFLREGLLVMLSDQLRIPIVVSIHGSSFPVFARRWRVLVRAVLRRAEVVVTLSDETDAVLHDLGLASVRLNNAVRIPPGFSAKSATFVFLGEVGIRKGVDVLIDAWGDGIPGASLKIIGPRQAGVLVEIPQNTGVTYVGPLEPSDALAELDGAASVVLPSRAEALPMALLEGMARGAYPIATPVGQVADLLSGVGTIVKIGDSKDLRAAMLRVADDWDKTALDGLRARERIAANFNEDELRLRLHSIWLSALHSRRESH